MNTQQTPLKSKSNKQLMLLHIPVLDLNYASNYSHNMTVQASLYLWTRPVRIRRGYQIQEVQDAAYSAQSPQNPSKD